MQPDPLPDQSGAVPMLHPASGATVQVDAQVVVDSLAALAARYRQALELILATSTSSASSVRIATAALYVTSDEQSAKEASDGA